MMKTSYDVENRQIRVFISSTFQDMQSERDYLITKVFPRLQAEAARRDVTIIPLDLRWGVTRSLRFVCKRFYTPALFSSG